MTKFANEFYRAISNNKCNFDPNGYLCKAAFRFNPVEGRKDDYDEMSINWNDCEKSLRLLMTQKNKKNCLLASFGYVCFSRTFLHQPRFHKLIEQKILSYERKKIRWNLFRRIKPNKYHGNILFTNRREFKKDRTAFEMEMANYANINHVRFEDYEKTINYCIQKKRKVKK